MRFLVRHCSVALKYIDKNDTSFDSMLFLFQIHKSYLATFITTLTEAKVQTVNVHSVIYELELTSEIIIAKNLYTLFMQRNGKNHIVLDND